LADSFDIPALLSEERLHISDHLHKLKISYMISLRCSQFHKLISTQHKEKGRKMASYKYKIFLENFCLYHTSGLELLSNAVRGETAILCVVKSHPQETSLLLYSDKEAAP
jgi:hypothetical protein